MQQHQLTQGSPEWHAHRTKFWNASDAPAMLGISPYKTRQALLQERATGMAPDVSPAAQARFDEGHRAESLARPVAEAIVGEELFPVTGTLGKLSASFDGLTMLGDTAFEHKLLNNTLRQAMHAGCTGADLPEHYRAQMEQQLMVSGAAKVLFMASRWDGDQLAEERHCWYESDPAMRQRIEAGWQQFEADLANYTPEPVQAKPVAAPVEGFGALTLRVEGRVLASNLDTFKAGADAFIARLPKPADLQTDQDFANAEAAAKACSEAETRIKAAKDAAMAQMADVDAVLRTADAVAEAIRAARLALEKAVKAEKENRKADILRQTQDALRKHVDTINASMGEYSIAYPQDAQGRFAIAIKGKKSLASMTDALAAELAALKIECSTEADNRRPGMALIAAIAPEHAGLFADRVKLVATYPARELERIIAARIAEHQQAEAARLEAERERIRKEEEARAMKAAQELPQPAEPATPAEPAANTPPTLRLSEINARLAPLSITADGLRQLGFAPAGHDRRAVLYHQHQFPAMCRAIVRHINTIGVEKP